MLDFWHTICPRCGHDLDRDGEHWSCPMCARPVADADAVRFRWTMPGEQATTKLDNAPPYDAEPW